MLWGPTRWSSSASFSPEWENRSYHLRLFKPIFSMRNQKRPWKLRGAIREKLLFFSFQFYRMVFFKKKKTKNKERMFQNIIVLIESERRSWLVLPSLNGVPSLSLAPVCFAFTIFDSAEVIFFSERQQGFRLQSCNPQVTSFGGKPPPNRWSFSFKLPWTGPCFESLFCVRRTPKVKAPVKSENISALIFALDSLVRWRNPYVHWKALVFLSLSPFPRDPDKRKPHAI